MRIKRCLCPLLIGLVVGSTLGAGESGLRTPAFLKSARTGFDEIYNLDYQQALTTFTELRKIHPDHPAPPLYMATAVWLKELFARQELDVDKFIAPSYFDKPTDRVMPAAERARFEELIAESMQKAEKILEANPGDKDARYFLGSAEGVKASFSITIDRSRSAAFKHGKKAYSYHHDLVEQDPEYWDAYMSVGLYEYVVGNLPWYIKWIATIIGYRGSKERGFEYLTLATQKGQFIADDARILQMVLFVREKRYEQALANVRHLLRVAPRNILLYLNEAQILERMGRTAEASERYQKIVEFAESGRPNFDRVPLDGLRYTVGRKLLELGEAGPALDHFQKAIDDPQTSPKNRVLSRLGSGLALDLQGLREKALEYYESVLSGEDFEDAHREARRYLAKPFGREG